MGENLPVFGRTNASFSLDPALALKYVKMIDPYGVLGVAGDAEFDTIRAAYRRLVRENHPDVAPDKEMATMRMAQINEAWLLLGAPEKRASFDALSRLQAKEQAALREAEERVRLEQQRRAQLEREKMARGGQRRSRSKRGTNPKPVKSGTATREVKSHSVKRGPAGKNPAREMRLLRKIARASQLFHREGRAEESAALCREVLLADGRNVQARELLGDILAFQGRIESALMMLDQAVQIAPDDRMLRRKRDSLQRQQQSRARAAATPSKKAPRLSLLGRLRARLTKSTK